MQFSALWITEVIRLVTESMTHTHFVEYKDEKSQLLSSEEVTFQPEEST